MRKTAEGGPLALGRRLRLVLGLVWACSPGIAISMFVLAVAAGLSPTATAWMTRDILDGLVSRPAGGHGPRLASPGNGHLIMLAVILCVIGLAGAVMPNAQRYIESQLRRDLDVVMRERTYGVINSFPGLSRFESPVFQDKIRMIQQSAQNVPARLINSGLSMTQSVITAVGFFGTLYVISPVLSAIVLATSIPAIVVQIDMSRKRAAAEWLTSGAKRKEFHFGQLLGDSRAAKEVRLFGLGGFLSDLMLAETRTANRRKRSIDRRTLWIEGSLELVAAIVSGAGLIWTVRQSLAGRMSVGDISLFIMAVVGVQRGVSTMVSGLADSYQQLIQFGHYDDVISAGPDLPLAAAPSPLPPLREGIELRDVWFRYDQTLPWVLFGVNMRIPAGKAVGLVGLNGAGKSTLVKLLCRFYDPEHGAIYWDGVDIRQVAPEELRARIGSVFQDYMSYELTARENIGVGDLDRITDLESVQSAADLAGADAAVSRLPDGYDTMLSRVFAGAKDKADPATGVFLSGGQWQRLAIARGMMRSDRDLLILDEPSSGLDAEAEHAIHSGLGEMRRGRTSLLISHRLGSVRDADMIFVLSGGHVAEVGTHDELMACQGEYHRLFTLQASGYTDKAATRE